MKSVSLYITKLLAGSLIVSVIVVSVCALAFVGTDDKRTWIDILLMIMIVMIIQSICSVTTYLNIRKDCRSNTFVSFLSFILFQIIYICSLIYKHSQHLGVDFFIFMVPYPLCMLISYILFRRFCKKELGE